MSTIMNATSLELICCIVNYGYGSKVLHIAKQNRITGGTVMLGTGTVNNKILSFLGISDVSKEIVLMIANKEIGDLALQKIDKEFKFEKPNHGIAFTTSVKAVVGSCSNCKEVNITNGGVMKQMYHSITVIVNKGQAEEVIAAAISAGSKGGTIINGRGSGTHETSKVFFMDIEPEKEIVIILSEIEHTDKIIGVINDKLKIDEPGRGILFVQEVNQAYGLYK